MNELHRLAALAARNYSGPHAVVDPSQILVFVSLISEIMTRVQSCTKTPKEALEVVKNPSIFQRLVVRRIVVDELGKKSFREMGDKVMAALLDRNMLANLSESDMTELLNSL